MIRHALKLNIPMHHCVAVINLVIQDLCEQHICRELLCQFIMQLVVIIFYGVEETLGTKHSLCCPFLPLQGVNRAFPFVSSDESDEIIETQTPILFQLVCLVPDLL